MHVDLGQIMFGIDRQALGKPSATAKLYGHYRLGRSNRPDRQGTTIVEFAIVLPVFLVFVFALFEFGHALMVSNMLVAVAKQAAHQGSFSGTSTAEVESFAADKLNAFLIDSAVSVIVKDASAYESSSKNLSLANYEDLPDIELNAAESRQLFLVHIEVPYADVALLPPFWVRNITLRGDSVMRKE